MIKFVIINILIIFIAASDVLCFIPAKLTSGGIFGLAIAIYHLFSFHNPWIISVTFILLNLPLLIYAYIKFSKQYFFNTIYIISSLSLFVTIIGTITQYYQIKLATNNVWVLAVLGSIIQGFSIGTIILMGASTGGVDIIARIVNKYCEKIKVGFGISIISILIILITAPIIGVNSTTASILSMLILGVCIDFINTIIKKLIA